jgi:hypothetical protein
MTLFARIGLFSLAVTAACDFGPQYCEGDWAAASPEEEPASTQHRLVAQVLPSESTQVDMLFVIDNSLSMQDEQEQLGIWSKELFSVLSPTGELPDLHIAVTSSSVAIPGLSQCASVPSGLHVGKAVLQNTRYLTDVAGPTGRVRNYSGSLTDTFALMARVGDGGCGFEQPFKAARQALSQPEGSRGFLRENALLLVVFVTDEDDCSTTDGTLFTDPYADACSDLGALTSYRCFEHGVRCYDGKGSREFGDRHNCRPNEDSQYIESVTRFADFVKGIKKNPAQVIVAGIYGKPNHVYAVQNEKASYQTPRLGNVCGADTFEGDGATPAVRMNAFMAKFGGRASQSSICESELSWAMRDVGLVTRAAATRSHCLRGALRDVDALAPGVQPACQVRIARDLGTPIAKHVDVLPCDQSSGERCFTIARDEGCGDTESQLAFRVDDQAANETLLVSCDAPVYDDRRPADVETRAIE